MINRIILKSSKMSVSLKQNTLTKVYLVNTDAEEDVQSVMFYDTEELPKTGEFSGDLVCDQIECDRHENSRASDQWFVYTATFTTPTIDVTFTEAPWDREPEINWEGQEAGERVKLVDFLGRPYRNSSGDLLTGIPPGPIPGGYVTITFNVELNPAELITTYSNTVSNTEFYDVPAWHTRIGRITAQKVIEPSYKFWRVTVPLWFSSDSWRLVTYDLGYNKVEDGDKQKITVQMKDPETGLIKLVEKTEPSFLDGSGGELADGADPIAWPPAEDDQPAGFAQLPEVDINGMDLPNPFED